MKPAFRSEPSKAACGGHLQHRRVAALVLAAAALCGPGTSAATDYVFSVLGPADSVALAGNEAGQVVGQSRSRATLWNGGVGTELGATAGTLSVATDINDIGQVVGYAYTPGSGSMPRYAVMWTGGIATVLPSVGGTVSSAQAVNNAGQVAGYSCRAGNVVCPAAGWSGGVAQDLGTLGGSAGVGTGINAAGQVSGFAVTSTNRTHAAVWNGGVAGDLDAPDGIESRAEAINDAGQAVGASSAWSGTPRATAWSAGVATDLGTLGGADSWAYAINNTGQIVGWAWTAGPGGTHAALWLDGVATDLNDVLDAEAVAAGWVLNTAYDINDNGWIVGVALNTNTRMTHAFVLSVVPEPASMLLMLIGLAVGALVVLQRRCSRGSAGLRSHAKSERVK